MQNRKGELTNWKNVVVACIIPILFIGTARAVELAPEKNRAMITPSLVRLAPSDTKRFKAIMMATYLMAADTPDEVIWSVNGIVGGDEVVGKIDSGGVYQAPTKAPKPNEVHICAEVPEAANRYLFATVLIGDRMPEYELVNKWGEKTREGKHLRKPHGIGLDRDGNLMIVDEGAGRVLRYTPKGEFLGEIGDGPGNAPGQFREPRAVTIDDDGRIWVTDSKGDRPRIQVFTHEGKFERIFAEKGILPGYILRAHGMDFNDEQQLFTVDVDNFRVNVYSHGGEFLYSWGDVGTGPGQFNAPHGLVVDPSGDVFVSGYYGPIQKFDKNGNYLFRFCFGDPPDGPVYFHSISGDQWGNIYAMVRGRTGNENMIQEGGIPLSIMKFNNNGDYITGWGLADPEHSETWSVIAEDGTVFSLFHDKSQNGIQTFVPR